MSIRQTLARNTLFNIGGRAWDALVSLILIPYIVWRVGVTDYGLWGLANAFTAYMGLLDVGMAGGYGKFIAEHAARDEHEKTSSVVSTGLIFYAAFGVVVLAVGWPLAHVAAQWMALDADRVEETRYLFRGALLLFVCSNCVAPFSAIQIGLQRMDISNAIGVAMSIVKVIATVALLETGFGVIGLLYANVAVLLVFGAASIAAAYLLLPQLRAAPWHSDRSTFRSLFRFGWQTQIARLANLVTFETDVLVIGFLLRQLEWVGFYKIGVELANKMRQVPLTLVGAILPAASDLDARADIARLTRLYVLSTKYVAAVTIPLVALTIGLAGPAVRTWMGPGYETSAWVLRIIAFGYLFNILPGPGVSIALGAGRPDLQMKAGLIAMISNVSLTLVLYATIGFWGIPIATALSLLITSVWFAEAMGSIIDAGTSAVARFALAWPALAAMPALIATILLDASTAGFVGRPANLAVLVLGACGFAGAYMAVIRLTPYFDSYDAEFLEASLPFGRSHVFKTLMGMARRA